MEWYAYVIILILSLALFIFGPLKLVPVDLLGVGIFIFIDRTLKYSCPSWRF